MPCAQTGRAWPGRVNRQTKPPTAAQTPPPRNPAPAARRAGAAHHSFCLLLYNSWLPLRVQRLPFGLGLGSGVIAGVLKQHAQAAYKDVKNINTQNKAQHKINAPGGG